MSKEININDNETTDEEDVTKELQDTRTDISKAENRLRSFQTFALQLIIIIIIIWMLFYKIVGLGVMPSSDMVPRIDPGDLMLYYKLDKAPKIQDVVVYTYENEELVGRVVARGGDVIDITDASTLLINGNAVKEPTIYEKTIEYEGFVEYPYTVPEGEFFILADHRNGGKDSRYYGAVKKEQLRGIVLNIIRRHNL